MSRMREASETEEFDKATFATAAKEFIPLLRQHIFKENNVLFKMAEQVLSEGDDSEMDVKFTQVEQERELAGMHERYDAEVARWEKIADMTNTFTHRMTCCFRSAVNRWNDQSAYDHLAQVMACLVSGEWHAYYKPFVGQWHNDPPTKLWLRCQVVRMQCLL